MTDNPITFVAWGLKFTYANDELLTNGKVNPKYHPSFSTGDDPTFLGVVDVETGAFVSPEGNELKLVSKDDIDI